MRITFVIPKISGGGAERVASILTSAWAARGATVFLLTFEEATANVPKYEIHPEVKYRALSLQSASRSVVDGFCNNVKRARVLRRAIRETAPDIVISFIHRMNVLTLVATRNLGVPVIVSERIAPSASIGSPWEVLRKLIYPWASAVVVQYDAMKSAYGRRVEPRAVTIPNPILPAHTGRESNQKDREKTVVAVGRFEPQKRLDLLLSAFAVARQQHPGWMLRILGDGKLKRELERQAHELDIQNEVEFTGRVANPTEFLSVAGIYVQSSELEGFPNALCEAMAAGLPVVATDCPGAVRDIVREGVDGFIVPNRDGAAIARAMVRLMGDAALREQMGEAAREVSARFSLEEILKKWDELFHSLGVR